MEQNILIVQQKFAEWELSWIMMELITFLPLKDMVHYG